MKSSRAAIIVVALGLAAMAGCGRPPAAQVSVSYLTKNAAGQYESNSVASMTTTGPPDHLPVGGSSATIDIKVVEVKATGVVLDVGGLNLDEERVSVPFGSQAEVLLGNKDVGVRIEAQAK